MRFIRSVLVMALIAAPAAARQRLQGYCERGGATVVVSGIRATPQVMQSFPGATVTVYITGGAAGVVNTAGTVVTLQSGTTFNPNGQWNGQPITINGTVYNISSVAAGGQTLTLSSSAGIQSTVSYSMTGTAGAGSPAAIYADNNGTPKANPFTCDATTAQEFFYVDNGTYDMRFSGTGITTPFTWPAVSAIDVINSIPNWLIFSPSVGTFAQQCAAAGAANQTLVLTSVISQMPTQTVRCPVMFLSGGMIQPASGATVTIGASIDAPANLKIFDISAGGTVAFGSPHPTVYPDWWGAVADGTGTGGTDQNAPIQAALNAAAGGNLVFSAAPSCYAVFRGPSVPSNTTVVIQPGACIQKLFGPTVNCPGTPCTSVLMVGDSTAAVSNVWIVGGGVIDGNRNNVTGISGDGYNQGINFAGCTSCGTRDITVKNAYTGGIGITCWGPTPATNAGNNVQILNTIITNSRRNNLENICGTNTVMRGGQLSNANGGSLSLGYDGEPFTAGQFITGAIIDGVEVFGNASGGISYAPPYDLNPNVMLTNVNCHDNGGAECLSSINFLSTGPSGTATITGGSYQGGTVAAIYIGGYTNVNISGETVGNSTRGLLVGSKVTNFVLGPGLVAGTSNGDISFNDNTSHLTMAGVQLGCQLPGAPEPCITPGAEPYVDWALTGQIMGWVQYCLPYNAGRSPRSGYMACANSFNVNDGANPNIRIFDGTNYTVLQQVTGAESRFGSLGASSACLESNNTCRMTADPSGNVTMNTTAATLTVNGQTLFQNYIRINEGALPSSCTGQPPATVWADQAANWTLKICP